MKHVSLSHKMIEEVYERLIASTQALAISEIFYARAVAELEQAKVDITNAGLEGSNAALRKAYLLDQTESEREKVEVGKLAADQQRVQHELNRMALREIELHARLAELEYKDEYLRFQTKSPRRWRRGPRA